MFRFQGLKFVGQGVGGLGSDADGRNPRLKHILLSQKRTPTLCPTCDEVRPWGGWVGVMIEGAGVRVWGTGCQARGVGVKNEGEEVRS